MPRITDWVEKDHLIARIDGHTDQPPLRITVHDRASGAPVPTGHVGEAQTHEEARRTAIDLLHRAAAREAPASGLAPQATPTPGVSEPRGPEPGASPDGEPADTGATSSRRRGQ